MDNLVQEVIEAKIEEMLVAGERISSPSLYGGRPTAQHLINRCVSSRKVRWDIRVFISHSAYVQPCKGIKKGIFERSIDVDEDIMPPFAVLYPALQFLFGEKCFIQINRIV